MLGPFAEQFCPKVNNSAPEIFCARNNSAPEIILSQSYDTHVDMWSAGVNLYILLSATPPFKEEFPFDQIVEAGYGFD